MKKFAYIENKIVEQIIPEFDEIFQNIPLSERFPADFILKLIEIKEGEKVETGYIYDEKTGKFKEPDPPIIIDTLEMAKEVKLKEVSQICGETIVKGVEFENEHYSLTANDQTNLITLSALAMQGKEVPYHADNQKCKFYSPENFYNFTKQHSVTLLITLLTTIC